jgi:DNA-binding MarR family transcriptional regulator
MAELPATLPAELQRQLALVAREARATAVLDDGSRVPRALSSLLQALADHEPAAMGEIAAALDVDPSTTTRQVQQAVRLGLVARVDARHDRRVALLTLTPAGRDTHAALTRRQRRRLQGILRGWSEEDQHELVRLLTRFTSGIDGVRTPPGTTRR